jgi:hypothetical protein
MKDSAVTARKPVTPPVPASITAIIA